MYLYYTSFSFRAFLRKKAEKADAKSKVDEEKLKEKNRELLERCERNWKSRPISLRSAATLPNDQYVSIFQKFNNFLKW